MLVLFLLYFFSAGSKELVWLVSLLLQAIFTFLSVNLPQHGLQSWGWEDCRGILTVSLVYI